MKGIDLCCKQHDVNWKQVKQSGQVDFIIPRTGWGPDCDGDGIDYKFLEYVRGAQDNGIAVPGVYHFIYVNGGMDDAVENAKCAIRAVEAAGLPKSTVIWCDQEEDTVVQAVEHEFNLTTDLQRKVTEIFCDYVLSQGYCTGVYLNRDYLTRVYGQDIMQKYDIWYADPYMQFSDPCLIKQNDWWGRILGIPTAVDTDVWVGTYTAGTAKPRQEKQEEAKVGLIDKFCEALDALGDGRYYYYGEGNPGIGCSDYVRLALQAAGIIHAGETFWAGQGERGVLEDSTRFQRIAWDPNVLQRGDILWSQRNHVAVWDGGNGVWEGSPVHTHGVCDNGKTGVGRRKNHTYWNCGNSTYIWSNIYRIIDPEDVKHDTQEEIDMDKGFIAETLAPYMPVIRSGKTGDMVKALQKIMAKYGWYAGEIDGSCGPLTVAGIRHLQTAIGVDADGSFGPKSWAALLTK